MGMWWWDKLGPYTSPVRLLKDGKTVAFLLTPEGGCVEDMAAFLTRAANCYEEQKLKEEQELKDKPSPTESEEVAYLRARIAWLEALLKKKACEMDLEKATTAAGAAWREADETFCKWRAEESAP